jgi:dihydrofolate reductase
MTTNPTTYNAIVAIDKQGRIGRNGKIPWSSPADMRHFASRTRHSIVLMGRKTFDSLPRVLEYRHHVVLSRDGRPGDYSNSGQFVMFRNSVEAAQQTCESIGGKVWVIGGAEIYKQFLPICESIVVTHIPQSFDMRHDSDVFMPEWQDQFPHVEPEQHDNLIIVRYWRTQSVEDKVIEQIRARQVAGALKYGTTMRRDDLSVNDWLQHAKEEMLDAAIYLQKLQDVQAQLKTD